MRYIRLYVSKISNTRDLIHTLVFVFTQTEFILAVFPDEGEPAPNIEEYSSISNYDDYDADTNSSTTYE